MNQIFDKLAKEFDWEIIKLWPTESDIKSQCVIKNFFDWKYHYTKVFVWEENIIRAKKEFEIINIFDQIDLENISFPKLVMSYEDEDVFYYTMEDIWWNIIDFSKLSLPEISEIYSLYRKNFDLIEKITDWISLDSRRFNNMEDLKNYYETKIIEYVDKWFIIVNSFATIDKNYLFDNLNKFDFSEFEKEYCFGRVWTGHVFDLWKNRYWLIDFDNIWYKIKWFELIELMRSNLLLNVEHYYNFEDYRNAFDKWLRIIKDFVTDKNTLRFWLYLKFIWTIFMDYGYLMKNNISTETLKKWITWNMELFKNII